MPSISRFLTYEEGLKTPHIYLFSGLGADERVFQKLTFPGYSITFVQWVTPDEGESMLQYAERLLPQIRTSHPILIGLSFGGMMAIEVAKLMATTQVILLSSAKNRTEIPFYFRFAGWLGLHHLLPTRLMKQASFISYWLFGAQSAKDRQLLKAILEDTDPRFLKWAINVIVHWRNQEIPESIQHIHGTNDRILPVRYVSCSNRIKGGGHLMVFNRSDEVQAILNRILGQRLLKCKK